MRIETNSNTNIQQEEPSKEKKVKKGTKKRIVWLVVLIIIIALPVMVIGATGMFNIPIITHIFGSNKPVNLGIKPSEVAFQSIMEKFPVEFKGEPNNFSGIGNKEFNGKVSVDAQYTSEEITSILNHFLQNAPHVRDIQVKYVEGGMEISAFVKTYVNAPVYAKVGVNKLTNKSVNIDLQNIKVGIIPIPKSYYDKIEKAAEDILNNRFAKIDSISIDQLEYHDGYSYLKGTAPASVQMLPGEEKLF